MYCDYLRQYHFDPYSVSRDKVQLQKGMKLVRKFPAKKILKNLLFIAELRLLFFNENSIYMQNDFV